MRVVCINHEVAQLFLIDWFNQIWIHHVLKTKNYHVIPDYGNPQKSRTLLKVTPTSFYEISKMSDIWSIFREDVGIGVVHIFSGCVSFVFLLFPRKGGGGGGVGQISDKLWMIFIRRFSKFSVFFMLLEELQQKYCYSTLKRCNNNDLLTGLLGPY